MSVEIFKRDTLKRNVLDFRFKLE